MAKKEVLKIGDKIGISVSGGRVFPTMIEDITEDGILIASVPLFRSVPIILKLKQKVTVFYYRDNGRFSVDCLVDEILVEGNLRLMALERVSEPRKQQRRNSYRLRINLNIKARPFIGGPFPPTEQEMADDPTPWEEVLTNNLSETGISFNSQKNYEHGDKLHVILSLPTGPDQKAQFDLLGIVRQVENQDLTTKRYRLGIEFPPYGEDDRRFISKFILRWQQQMLRDDSR